MSKKLTFGDVLGIVVKTNTRKLIRHKWTKITTSGKLKHAVCERCHLQKYFVPSVGHLMYEDGRGNSYYRTPSCVLPNTKL